MKFHVPSINIPYNELTKILKALFENKSSLAEKMPELTRGYRSEVWQSDILNICKMAKYRHTSATDAVREYASKIVFEESAGFKFFEFGYETYVFFGEEDSRSLLVVRASTLVGEKFWEVHLLSSDVITYHKFPKAR